MLSLFTPLAIVLLPGPGFPSAWTPLPTSSRECLSQQGDERLVPPTEGPVRAMLLRLEDGRFLRARARQTDAGFEIRTGDRWVLVQEASVAEARLEKDVLRDAKLLERGIDRDDWVRRSAHADWLLRHGLAVEGLKAFDRILREDPGQAAAYGVLQRCDAEGLVPLALPDASEQLDAFLARMESRRGAGPAAQVIGAGRLARAFPRTLQGSSPDEPKAAARRELGSRLRADLVNPDASHRTFAALALGIIFPGDAQRDLLRRSVLDVKEPVRLAAAAALAADGDAAVEASWLGALASQSSTIRTNAIEALGIAGSELAVAPLVSHLAALPASGTVSRAPHSYVFVGSQRAYVSDFDVEVASGQSIADPIINVLASGSVLDAAVVATSGPSPAQLIARERGALRRTLERLTGADPGSTTRAWTRWWKAHSAEYPSGETVQGKPQSPRTSRDS